MTVQRDVRTVTPVGDRLAPLPDGVVLRDHTNPDEYRPPLEATELPVELGPGWHGW